MYDAIISGMRACPIKFQRDPKPTWKTRRGRRTISTNLFLSRSFLLVYDK